MIVCFAVNKEILNKKRNSVRPFTFKFHNCKHAEFSLSLMHNEFESFQKLVTYVDLKKRNMDELSVYYAEETIVYVREFFTRNLSSLQLQLQDSWTKF